MGLEDPVPVGVVHVEHRLDLRQRHPRALIVLDREDPDQIVEPVAAVSGRRPLGSQEPLVLPVAQYVCRHADARGHLAHGPRVLVH